MENTSELKLKCIKCRLTNLYKKYWKDEYILDETITKKMRSTLAMLKDCKSDTEEFFAGEASMLFLLLYMKFIISSKSVDVLPDAVKSLEKTTDMIIKLRDMEDN